MENNPDIQLGGIKNEERYKSLERNLKIPLVRLRQMKTNNKNYSISPNWSSASTINSEVPDTTTNGRKSAQVSRIESDIVSSSSNLRKVFPVFKNHGLEQTSMVTSSVKKFSDKDRPLMPPPRTYKDVLQNEKKQLNISSKYSKIHEEHKKQESDSVASDTSKKVIYYPREVDDNQLTSLKKQQRKNYYVVFTNWRVVLNNKQHLIIKGTLDCGKAAKSKPVWRRLASNEIQCIYEHVYFLKGNLIDEKCELPDYVRGKFCNGFPDDWENVYELWKNYINEGFPVKFRWPTRITDSDDDLNSEVTEITFCKTKPKTTSYKEQPQFNKNSYFNHKSLDNSPKPKAENSSKLENSKTNDVVYVSPTVHVTNKKDDSGHSSGVKCNNVSNTECITNTCNISSPSNSCVKNESFLHEIIREDKLKIILSYLGNKNFSLTYFNKFIQLVDCLKYIVAYTSCTDYELYGKKDNSAPSKNYMQGCEKCSNAPSILEDKVRETEIQHNIQNVNTKPEEIKKNSEEINKHVSSQSLESDNVIENKSSNSDSYMGVPNMNLNNLLMSKIRRQQRYKDLKRRNRNKTINSDKQFKKPVTPEKQNGDTDSCISISEYEPSICQEQFRQYKKQRLSYNLNKNPNVVKTTYNNKVHQNQNTNVSKTRSANNKPIIKNCEQVYFNLRLKNSTKSQDTNVKNHRNLEKKNIYSHDCNNMNDNEFNISDNEERLDDEILQHPFLTYDSEDFENDADLKMHLQNLNNEVEKKESSKNVSLENKTMPFNDKIENNEPFGSKQNPKILVSWMPCVEYDELQKNYILKFKGKLLNEAGHILNRKCITDSVYRRHSSKLVETVNNEFFLLFGEFSNKNHVIPKQLQKQCYIGCPLDIKKFCTEWIKYKSDVAHASTDDKLTNVSNTSINDIAVSTSSRGRRIIPPLNYWQGERISTKNYDTVYNPGNTRESSLIQKSEEVRKSMVVPNNKKHTANMIISASPNKRFKSNNNVSPNSLRKPVNRQILANTPSSHSSNNSGNEFNSKIKKIETVNEYTRKLRARNTLKKNVAQSEDSNTRSKTGKVIWTYGRGEFVDNLSDDLASVR